MSSIYIHCHDTSLWLFQQSQLWSRPRRDPVRGNSVLEPQVVTAEKGFHWRKSVLIICTSWGINIHQLKLSSIGLKSGAYRGWNIRRQPVLTQSLSFWIYYNPLTSQHSPEASTTLRRASLLCVEQLSMTMTLFLPGIHSCAEAGYTSAGATSPKVS